jgi:hypothetical protein
MSAVDERLQALLAGCYGLGNDIRIEREATGALKFPPKAAVEVAEVLRQGGENLGSFDSYLNDGRTVRTHLEAASRHTQRMEDGETVDHDTGKHPLAHVIARMMLALELELRDAQREVVF